MIFTYNEWCVYEALLSMPEDKLRLMIDWRRFRPPWWRFVAHRRWRAVWRELIREATESNEPLRKAMEGKP